MGSRLSSCMEDMLVVDCLGAIVKRMIVGGIKKVVEGRRSYLTER